MYKRQWEHRRIKKVWREYNRKRTEKRKSQKQIVAHTLSHSDEDWAVQESHQKKRGRKKIRREKAKAYRKIAEQENQIKHLKRKLEKYKKRLQRKTNKMKDQSSPSPKKSVSNLIGKENVSPKIKKQLFWGYVLERQLKSQIKDAGTKNKKQQLNCKACLLYTSRCV